MRPLELRLIFFMIKMTNRVCIRKVFLSLLSFYKQNLHTHSIICLMKNLLHFSICFFFKHVAWLRILHTGFSLKRIKQICIGIIAANVSFSKILSNPVPRLRGQEEKKTPSSKHSEIKSFPTNS